ncbi:hypothetical protein A2U01_0083359, partial [Trifolium medium]|nr:hypothetical protein [Trifolium medium]
EFMLADELGFVTP